jgi:hypothetical protein
MKYATARPYADPEKAARRILEIANAVEPIQGRFHIEKINEPYRGVSSSPVRSHLTVCQCGRQAARLKQEEATELT